MRKIKQAKKIKFIYFDIGGVVLRWRSSLEKVVELMGVEKSKVEEVFRKYDDDACRGLYTLQELWQKYNVELKLSHLVFLDFHKFWIDNFVIYKSTHELLCSLTGKYRLGALTNIHKGSWERCRENGSIPDIPWEVVVKSCDVALVKPQREIYELAHSKVSVLKEEVLFVDDSEKNITAAKEFGWNTFLFDENNPGRSTEKIKKILQ